MAIGFLASIGLGIVSSIFQKVTSGVSSKTPEVREIDAASAPSFRVELSESMNAMKKNVGVSGTAATRTPIDQLLSRSSDPVKKAWEKTRQDLGLDADRGYYINPTAMMSLMAEARLRGGIDSDGNLTLNQKDFFGTSAFSAISAIDAVINRLNSPIPGYDQNPRDRQAALEMYTTFRQNLASA